MFTNLGYKENDEVSLLDVVVRECFVVVFKLLTICDEFLRVSWGLKLLSDFFLQLGNLESSYSSIRSIVAR